MSFPAFFGVGASVEGQRGISLALSSISPNSSASPLSLSLYLSVPSLYPLFSRFLRGWCTCLRQSKKEAAQRDTSLAGLALSSISPNSSASSLSLSLSLYTMSFLAFFGVGASVEGQRGTGLALSSISPNSSASSLFLSLSLSLSLSFSLSLSLSLPTLFFPAFLGVGASV